MNIKDIRNKINWFKNNPDLVYADSAATSLKPNSVIVAITSYYDIQSSNPHNSDSQFAMQALTVMKECRKLCAELIDAEMDEVIFTSGATESINLFAQSLAKFLKKGDEIVLTKYEHSSNLLPWYHLRDTLGIKIVFIEVNNFEPKIDDFLKVINEKTKVVSFTGTSNLIGLNFDVNKISSSIKNKFPEVFVCADVAQMIPHKKCSVKKSNVDFMAFSAHKIFGPTGIGVAYIKKKIQEKIEPFRFGGGMNFSVNKDNFCYIDGVEKFEGGTPHVAGIYGWIPALKFLKDIGYELIEKHEQEIYNLLYNSLKDNSNIVVYNWRANSPIIAFNVKGVFCQDTAAYLGKKGIIVRSGLSCAKLMNEVLDTDGLVRASFYVYNSLEDVKKFIDAIKDLTKEKVLSEII